MRPGETRVRQPDTVDEWVYQVNSLAAELDARCAGLHSSAWDLDPDITRLIAQYQAVAGTFSAAEERAAQPAQLTLEF